MSEDAVFLTAHPDVSSAAIIRLHRPQTRNALRPQDARRLNELLMQVQHDPAIKLVFITGSEGAFTGGADINAINELSGPELSAFVELQVDLLTRIVAMPKIVVAAVNGVTAGLGNHISICADLCFAVDTASFNFTGAAKGLPSLLYGTLMLPMTIGLKRAKAIYLRGGKITAREAVEYGFCNEAVAPADWDATLAALAEEFAPRNPMTLAHNKYQLNQAALQLAGAAKLSGLAGSAALSTATDIPTGRVRTGPAS
ncbi:enoyl-CoA hydratase/isomerase family protein [Bosea sp. (in: a-proteobacteria)]|uniref:enoyl-CoA hydratase/isomerase family protein n=1 Tax=Bosea sp. (in: a-proteobacteria) TaxID=1871050 RepID=UPI0026165EA0|nr:enoyl-CoA hydratase/isomerase family protein [Bosea sp. (in: a-proteobacteria)]MCO5089579.1 enoyl-CoA hydratase/isomerase family protein [Bosea sp. (in: a-proteobacteria)]